MKLDVQLISYLSELVHGSPVLLRLLHISAICFQGHFQPVPGGYSPGFRQLIHDLLQKDPVFRPTAAEILDCRLPKLLESLREEGGHWFLDHDGSLPSLKASCNR